MPIILLNITSRQLLHGRVPEAPQCPQDATHPLVKNGTYRRHADLLGKDTLTIQRYFCRACHQTYSALPYDLRPYSTVGWALMLAASLLWRVTQGWTLERCLDWFAQRDLPYHRRTLERWRALWDVALPGVVQAALLWIGQHLGTRAVSAFPGDAEPSWHHWRRLWQAARDQVATGRAGRRGGWLGTSVLWGWLSITVFAGLSPG